MQVLRYIYRRYNCGIAARRISVIFCAVLLCVGVSAQDEHFLLEFGALGGGSYYIGDATPHVFMNVRPAYGGYFRYKFDRRWNLTVKALYTDLECKYNSVEYKNRLVNLDASAEYNFLPYGSAKYDTRVKPYTPFMYIGLGSSLHSSWSKVGVYIPFGIGFKWNFARHGHLSLMWQHQLYFADNIEGAPELDNRNDLNGWNFLNNDWLSTFVMSLSFDFLTHVKTCNQCGIQGKYAF